MPLVDKTFFERAIHNIAHWGDTDIFPFPIDNHVAHDKAPELARILEGMGSDLTASLHAYPVLSHSTLSPVGYSGFRWATQIDPLWNAYLLGVTLSLAQSIEAARIPRSSGHVYSYRFEPEADRLFWSDGWSAFQERTRELASRYKYVVVTDIADFYPRLYHHRIENALQPLDATGAKTGQIMDILIRLSNSTSYGLPVGGPAARILSEITIDQIDRLLLAELKNGEFCRFADDYRIFVDDLQSAHHAVGFLSEKLFLNQGLSLQKSKTTIMRGDEYLAILDPTDPPEGSASRFLKLHLHFDPYSETPLEDYERLRGEIDQFDILDLLRRELLKGQVHTSVTKKLVKALRFLDVQSRELAVRSLLDQGNFERLAPIMPQVLMSIGAALVGASDEFVAFVCKEIRSRIEGDHYLARVELNLAYMIRLLAMDHSPETEQLLIRLYDRGHGYRNAPSPLIQRDIMLVLGRWEVRFWLSDQRSRYQTMHPWVKRAFAVASYSLGDEGRHWRRANKKAMIEYDQLMLEWAGDKVQLLDWRIPL
ncbi:RNA-directed DNA polymerase [Isoptericola sp. NPDC056618]|uniref:RNA-directed DNA polymerase n=1 Tax=Isoptericola sp. NPDC056618 TaxID=3345878 RepID=UPI0036BEF18B